ncbi:MAG TPA: cbb3-type cytochrome c oxidase subunit I [Thiotrichales bacterium]|nr:cbb3-type cytochrome c oxidase subunit I [Thiotrichales bacterium]
MNPPSDHHPRTGPRAWLVLGVYALIAAGALALLLVAARSPGIGERLPWPDVFHTALVVHVDLSVLVWFLAFSALLWSLDRPASPLPTWLSLGLAWAGTLLLSISPFVGDGPPLQNNYVPVLLRPLFHAGLGLFALGILMQALLGLRRADTEPFRSLTTRLSALTVLVAALLFLHAFLVLDNEALPAAARFEYLFWSSGHVLQFSHGLMLLLCWHLLLGPDSPVHARPALSNRLAMLAFIPVLAAPLIEWRHAIDSAAYRLEYTQLMRFGGLLLAPLGAWLAWRYLARPGRFRDAPRTALGMSILLFAAGGVLGFLIHGANVVIPAHYHGSIVGVTLAFMGTAYLLLPTFGHRLVLTRLARWQPVVYGGGQLLHIAGLAWSGGYGVQRKVAGGAQALDTLEKTIAMGLMGLGGLIAVIGGLLFVVVMVGSLARGGKLEARS